MGLNVVNLGKKAITAIFCWDFGPSGSAWKNTGVDPGVSMRRVAAKRGGDSPQQTTGVKQQELMPTKTPTEEKDLVLA